MPLTEAQEKQIIDFLADPAKALKLGDIVQTAVGQATTTLSKSLEEIAGTVKTLAATPTDKGDDKNKGKPDPVQEAIKAGIEAALKPINERLAKEDAAKGEEAKKATRQALIEKTLTDLKHGGMIATHKTFVANLHAAGVENAEQIKQALTAYKAEMKAVGVEIKETVASPNAEGANAPTAEDTEAAAIERIQANARNRPGSLADVAKPAAKS